MLGLIVTLVISPREFRSENSGDKVDGFAIADNLDAVLALGLCSRWRVHD